MKKTLKQKTDTILQKSTPNKGKILFYGAGAIGRGYLAPIFNKLGYEIFFVDKNPKIVNELKKRNSYKTAFTEQNNYKIITTNYKKAFFLGEEDNFLNKIDIVISCAGPNNIKEFAHKLKKIPTIISFENERESVDNLKKLSKNKNCYFGIPDVITSNNACEELLKIDPLCLISEKGDIAIEKGNFTLPKEIPVYSNENLEKYWNCKFYIHNMPHAVVAFLGKLVGVTYVHEAMQIPIINYITKSAMNSIKNAMKIKKMADDEFIEFYAEKEIKRFANTKLFDTISRVGREPIRKLKGSDRLIQSAKFIQETNQNSDAINLTIKIALCLLIMFAACGCRLGARSLFGTPRIGAPETPHRSGTN